MSVRENKTILVTGGAGYIGSHTLVELLEEGYNVVVLDQLTNSDFNGRLKAINDVSKITKVKVNSPRLRVYNGNVGNKELLKKILSENHIDACIDFAAFIEAGLSMQKPESYFENNVVNFYNLVKTLYKKNISKIIKSSTAAAYGNLNPGRGFKEEDVFTQIKESALDPALTKEGKKKGEELHQYLIKKAKDTFDSDPKFLDFLDSNDAQTRLKQPVNVYGWTKVMNELILEYFAEKYNKKYVNLRYFNAWGVREGLKENHHPETHLIPLAMDKIRAYEHRDKTSNTLKESEFLPLYGTDFKTPDGTCIRDYIHVEELAKAHVAALEAPNGTYNLGTGEGISNRDMLEYIAKGAGVKLVVLKKKDRDKKYIANCNQNNEPVSIEIIDKSFKLPEKALVVLEWEKRQGDSPKLIADPGKANSTFGWKADISPDKEHMEQVYHSRTR